MSVDEKNNEILISSNKSETKNAKKIIEGNFNDGFYIAHFDIETDILECSRIGDFL